jgi:metal-responsive CopG/Arc/MetJ family transcriptional regulator
MQKVKTAISIDQTLLTETENLASEMNLPKSQVVSLALKDFIQRYRNKQLLAQINQAYSDAPDAEDESTMAVIRSYRRKIGEQDEWK